MATFALATVGYDLNVTANGTIIEVAPFSEFYHTAQFVTGLICYPILCALGLVGNTFILIVMSQKSMTTSTNVYLSALAVSDIIKLINDVLYSLTILLLKVSPIAGNRMFGYLYPHAHFVFNMSSCVSSWLTVSVAFERYILVCHPTRSVSLITRQRAVTISVACYVIMTSVAVPSALRYRTVQVAAPDGTNATWLGVELTALWQDGAFVLVYNWLQSSLRSIVPLFILVFVNAFIINALRRTRANKKLASRNKITVMLIVVIVFFLVCIIPDAVMSAFFNLGYVESDNYLVKGVREITDMLLAVNAAINYPLYMIFNKIFRDQFFASFCRATRPGEDKRYSRVSHANHHRGTTAHAKDSISCTNVTKNNVKTDSL
ncbi:hypothetical protein NP493_455g01013 [Ridgeia piscesae]|uniref:G-protein coupled receptors family 1 profile domain-containing protein n=1 Tax=Ridgeia piscesae TaxID=27915 RepID=A0AAD9KZD3_RIDPI|nr:hypothetical protein NP493_455g01013 [Ridgeia piscesae]